MQNVESTYILFSVLFIAFPLDSLFVCELLVERRLGIIC